MLQDQIAKMHGENKQLYTQQAWPYSKSFQQQIKVLTKLMSTTTNSDYF